MVSRREFSEIIFVSQRVIRVISFVASMTQRQSFSDVFSSKNMFGKLKKLFILSYIIGNKKKEMFHAKRTNV